MLILSVAVPALLLAFGCVSPNRVWMRAFRIALVAEVAFIATLACIGYVYESRSRARDRALYPPPGKLVDVGGYRLHIQCAGQGEPTVVLDAGLVGSSLDWHLVFPALSANTRVCAYDRGGYGWSDRSSRPRTLEGITEDLHQLLNNSGEKPPYILVGHSLGGLNMWAYAARFPAETSGLVLVDSAQPEGDIPFPWRDRVFMKFQQLTLPFGLPRWRGWCGGGPEQISATKTAVACRPELLPSHYEQWDAIPKYLEGARKLPNLGSLPVIVVARDPKRGRPDESSQHLRWQQQMAGISSAGKLVIAEGSGHGIPAERPDAVIAAVEEILRQTQRMVSGKDRTSPGE